MVLCTSVSKTLKKQSLHICCPVFGRLRIAFAFWQRAQLFGAIVDNSQRAERRMDPAGGPAADRIRNASILRSVADLTSLLLATTTTMPKELRKRGRRHKTTRTEDQKPAQGREVPDEGEGPSTAGPSWIVPRTDSKQQLNPEAPFGYVDPELKAYFRTVDDQLKEWQQNRDHAEGEDDIDPNESASYFVLSSWPLRALAGAFFFSAHSTFLPCLDRRLFLMAALQEISGKERELATDPDCAGGLERMAYSMDDFVRRVFMDALTGS